MGNGKAAGDALYVSPGLMVRSVAQRRVSNHDAGKEACRRPSRRRTQVGYSRLAHRKMPISGNPEIGARLLRMRWSECKKSKVRVECRVTASRSIREGPS